MKKPLLISVSALALLTLSATLFAQTATGSSLISQMKAATHAFTLAGDLNPGTTGLESSPLVGKRTGDMLSAGEYNRLLELVAQGGGGGTGVTLLDAPVTIINDSAASTGTLSLADKVPACATSVILGSRIGILVGNAPRANDAEAYMSINNAEVGRVYLDAALHHTNAYDVSEGIFALSSNKSITWAVTTGGNFTSLSKYVFLKGYICAGGSGGTGGGSQSNIIKGTASVGFTNGQPHSTMATVSFGRTCTNPVITVQTVADSILCGTGASAGNCSNAPGTTSQDLSAYFHTVTNTGFQVFLSGMSGVWVGATSPAFYINYIVACD